MIPWRASVGAELVVHDLDLLVDQDVGQLDGRVGDGVLDDPVGELVAGPVEGVALEPRRGSPPAGRRGPRTRPACRAKSSSRSGRTFSRSSVSVDREVGRLPGEALSG